jgi:stress responsive alpha/beta barrel protein
VIAHLILFQPKADLAPAARQAVLSSLGEAAASIPGIQRFRVGRRVRHGLPGYEQAMEQDFTYVVLIELDDLDALKAYLAHPSHAAFGSHFTESATAALAYDYELVEAGEARMLVDKG